MDHPPLPSQPPPPSRVAPPPSSPSLQRRAGRTSKDNPEFLATFFQQSRLHFIGAWKERYQDLLDTLPAPPPGGPPLPPPGGDRVIFHLDMVRSRRSPAYRLDRPCRP